MASSFFKIQPFYGIISNKMLVEALGNFIGRVVEIARRPGPPLEAEIRFLGGLKAAFRAEIPETSATADPTMMRMAKIGRQAALRNLLNEAYRRHILPGDLEIDPRELIANFRIQQV